MRYPWLLFDADGTLFDYNAAERKALAATFTGAGLPYEDGCLAVYREINDDMWAAFERGEITQPELHSRRFELTLAALGLQTDVAAFAASYRTNLGNSADLIDGAAEVIPQLAARHKLYLITNGIPAVQHSRLALSPIGCYFEGIVISGEVGHAKPDPRIFDAAFSGMGSPPKNDVLIIGDSLPADIAGGHAYGIDTCWFNENGRLPTPAQPMTREIHSLLELVD